jgi:hypothetical protein
MMRSWGAAAVVATAIAVPRNGSADADPFLLSRGEVVRRVHTVAIASLGLPKSLAGHSDTRATFESLIETALRSGGFQVVASDSFAAAHHKMADSVGGLFNPTTGKRDSTKIRAMGAGIRSRLRATSGADGILYPEIVETVARFLAGAAAKWDGTSERTGPGESFLHMITGSSTGTLPALSLRVKLEDIEGNALYANVGGIQLLMQIKDHQFIDVPDSLLLRNSKSNEKAVHLALDQLVQR